ncbi:MAG: hypothetical protein ACRD1O_03810, partial [Terriglobia bacterium]
FGLDAVVESPFMSTAIVSQFTSEGFVIAADGLRKKYPSGEIVSSTAQKIFSFVKEDTVLAYAFSGSVEVPNRNEEIAFSFIDECKQAARVVGNTTLPQSFDTFIKILAVRVNERVAEARESGLLSEYPSCPNDPSLMVKAIFLGFYRGLASRAAIEFRQNEQVLADPMLTRLQTAGSDLKQFEIFSGSEIVANHLFHTAEPDLARYRTPSIGNVDLAKRQLPGTVEEAAQLAESYIQACIDNPHLDQESCRLIGGHIHVAKISKREGFAWVKAPLNESPRPPGCAI